MGRLILGGVLPWGGILLWHDALSLLIYPLAEKRKMYMYDAGLPHPPFPPPHPMVSPLASQVGSCLVWPCCFPRLVLFGLVPSPPPPPVEWGLWSFWLAPPRSTDVWHGCCRLLVEMSSLRALSPPPPVGWGLWSFWLAPPRLCGAVCSTKICMVWLLPLVSSNVTCSLPYKIALFSWQTVPLSLL